MTRSEFDEECREMSDVIHIAEKYNYDDYLELYDIIYGDNLSDCIEEDLRSVIGDWDWEQIRNYLNDIDDGCDYYMDQGYLYYTPLNRDDICSYIKKLKQLMEDNDDFEDEEIEPEQDDTETVVMQFEQLLSCAAISA